MLPDYKSNRAKAPPGFGADLRNLQQLLQFMRVYTVTAAGYEADDLLAGVAMKASRAGYTVRVYSSDMDLFQVGQTGMRYRGSTHGQGQWRRVTYADNVTLPQLDRCSA